MEYDLDDLERQLLANPFDGLLRLQYADALRGVGRHAEATDQYRLVIGQDPGSLAARLGLCRALANMGLREQAFDEYKVARDLGNFQADAELEMMFALPVAASPFTVVQGGGGQQPMAEIVPIDRVRPVRFADVVGMVDLKKTIRMRIIDPFLRPGLFARFKKRRGGGILLYGPPGCGKTLIARAVAGECDAHFISVGISDVLSKWIGEAEQNIAALFDRAREQAPSVLFFDELDTLAYARQRANSEHTRSVVNEFLQQLDGARGPNDRVLILAATNMPWDVDGAMKRPGRFDKAVFVPPPDAEARAEMFRRKLVGVPIDDNLDFGALGRATAQASGADVDGILEAAKDTVLSEILSGEPERPINQRDLLEAARSCEPSTVEWLQTAHNLVKFGGDRSYKEVAAYLKSVKLP
jgi:transitional endoplasmic reticulum ATPase